MSELTDRALARDKFSVASLVSLFEDHRSSVAGDKAAVLAELDRKGAPVGVVIGVTGPPGVGKSSLVSSLSSTLLGVDESRTVAVVAVDPSSPVSGGALLGDRTRLGQLPSGDRFYFRSQASERVLGGVGPKTFEVARLLRRLFDVVFVETVGVGQSEVEIAHLADHSMLVLSPLSGDQIQFMKSGIIEVPDLFVVNKCDLGADDTAAALRRLVGMNPAGHASVPHIMQVSALSGTGLDELADWVSAQKPRAESQAAHFLAAWVAGEYGRVGLLALGEPGEFLTLHGTYEHAVAAFPEHFRRFASKPGGPAS